MMKMIKSVSCVALAAAVTVTGVQIPGTLGNDVAISGIAEAATAINRVPLVTYTKGSGNLTTYTNSSLTKKTGYICPNDLCTILNVYSNGTVRVRYPVSRGTKTAYAAMSGFFLNTGFSTVTRRMGTAKTAYRKSTGNSTIGSVYASDQVIIIGTANGRTQLIYPTSSGYKLGWVAGTYSAAANSFSGSGYIPGGMGTQNTAPAANKSVASKMVSYELSQLGIGDTKGNNNVKYNTWYWGRTIKGSGYAWCMTFQAYCCNQVTGSNNAIPKTASCTSAVNIFKSRGQFQYSRVYGGNYTPKVGDLVFYTSNGGKNSCHVGMITGVPVNGYLQTVEGNIQCSDGNWKVVKFTKNAKRTLSNSYVWGYATPGY